MLIAPMSAPHSGGGERRPPLVSSTRADDPAHGVGRSPAPLFVPRCRAPDVRRSTEPEDGQLQGWIRCSSICVTRTPKGLGRTGSLPCPVRKHGCRRSPSGASSRRSCATDGGTAARRAPVLRQALGLSRAGYRSAQDLHRGRPYARGFACYAAGRSAGGSACPCPLLRRLGPLGGDLQAHGSHVAGWV